MTKPLRRCALYTRKSSEDGLEQGFNSLDARREASAAYVRSQAGEGWRALPAVYDDGGCSGGSMERPALRRLLGDIAARRVDVVVVYKIDRLTRNLADFARTVEIFDRHEVGFVSVTQAFNTTSSMGRLTLNVLLSFAQFEREVTGERIRDKIAASKAKGMWMGGVPPLGYDPPETGSRALVVNPAEAGTVRTIFATYLDLASVHALEPWLAAHGIRSKARTPRSGRTTGGARFSRGALFRLLRNKVYLGLILHRGVAHPGLHAAIVSQDLFDAVQARLDANCRPLAGGTAGTARSPLTGRFFDAEGHPMSPAATRGRNGRPYRYYVSAPLQQGRRAVAGDGVVQRLPAAQVEAWIAGRLQAMLPDVADPLDLPARIELAAGVLQLSLPAAHRDAIGAVLAPGERVEADPRDPSRPRLVLPFHVRPRGGRTGIAGAVATPPQRDPVLIEALRTAQRLVRRDRTGLPSIEAAPPTPWQRKIVRLAFLAPDPQRAILAGTQASGSSLARLLEAPLPEDWGAQHRLFGLGPVR